MATVRITESLIQQVISSLGASYKALIEKELAKLGEKEFGDQFYHDNLPAEVIALAEQLPADWLTYRDAVRAQFGDTSVDINFTRTRPIPNHWSNYYHTTLKPKPGTESARIIVETFNAIKDLAQQRDNLQERVRTLMTKSPSLARVVEVWPTVLDYVGDDVKKRLDAPPPKRRTKAEIAAEMNFNDETANAIIKARIIGT